MQFSQLSFLDILNPYKQFIENKIQNSIEQLGPKSVLRDACEYSLLNGGKRFRPALVLMIAKALGKGMDVSQAAMGIEFFHTASLIADDLPCMDDDAERRNRPTVHCVFGESVAILATYALISSGYACLAKNALTMENGELLCVRALENVSWNTGLFGATGGQFLDLSPPNLSLSVLREILHKKTVTLFEISFVLGWLFGGGDQKKLDIVKKSAAHFGMAFQIADDIEDMEQDFAHDHSLNIANIFGKQFAFDLFCEEMNGFNETVKELSLQESDLQTLAKVLFFQVNMER